MNTSSHFLILCESLSYSCKILTFTIRADYISKSKRFFLYLNLSQSLPIKTEILTWIERLEVWEKDYLSLIWFSPEEMAAFSRDTAMPWGFNLLIPSLLKWKYFVGRWSKFFFLFYESSSHVKRDSDTVKTDLEQLKLSPFETGEGKIL